MLAEELRRLDGDVPGRLQADVVVAVPPLVRRIENGSSCHGAMVFSAWSSSCGHMIECPSPEITTSSAPGRKGPGPWWCVFL